MTPCLEPSLPSTKMAAAATLDVTDTDKALLRPRVKSFTPAHIALFGALVLFSFVAPAIVVFYSKEEAPTTIHAASGSGAEAQLATRQDWIIVAEAPPDFLLNISFAVEWRNVGFLIQLLTNISMPHHEQRGRFLTQHEVHSISSNPKATSAVRRWLEDAGVSVTTVDPYGHGLLGTATVALWMRVLSVGSFVVLASQNENDSMRVVIRARKSVRVPSHIVPHLAAIHDVAQLPVRISSRGGHRAGFAGVHQRRAQATGDVVPWVSAEGCSKDCVQAGRRLQDFVLHGNGICDHRNESKSGRRLQDYALRNQGVCDAHGQPIPSVTPGLLRSFYRIPPNAGGSTVSQAVVQTLGQDYSSSDLLDFFRLFGSASSITDLRCEGQPNVVNANSEHSLKTSCVSNSAGGMGSGLEADVDSQYISAISPQTPTTVLYDKSVTQGYARRDSDVSCGWSIITGMCVDRESAVTGTGLAGWVSDAINVERARSEVVSISWSIPESDLNDGEVIIFNYWAIAASLNGTTFVAASGALRP